MKIFFCQNFSTLFSPFPYRTAIDYAMLLVFSGRVHPRACNVLRQVVITSIRKICRKRGGFPTFNSIPLLRGALSPLDVASSPPYLNRRRLVRTYLLKRLPAQPQTRKSRRLHTMTITIMPSAKAIY